MSGEFFGFSPTEMAAFLSSDFGKGKGYSHEIFRQIHRTGKYSGFSDPGFDREFILQAGLSLPAVVQTADSSGSQKFIMRLEDGTLCETVILKMSSYNTVCVSTQIGCRMNCAFCQTGRMGYVRNLAAHEIVTQVINAVHTLGFSVRNVVFMGMGEPFDNFDNVMKAIDILNDSGGQGIAFSSLCISTCGYIPGIRRFLDLVGDFPRKGYGNIRLAFSLNAANDRIRSSIMPVNRKYPLERLRLVLDAFPRTKRKDNIFIEYVLIPGLNDSRTDAADLADYLKGLQTCVNIIALNPVHGFPFTSPNRGDLERFFGYLRGLGCACRVRDSRGGDIKAGCGQLGYDPVSSRNG